MGTVLVGIMVMSLVGCSGKSKVKTEDKDVGNITEQTDTSQKESSENTDKQPSSEYNQVYLTDDTAVGGTPKTYYEDSKKQAEELKKLLKANNMDSHIELIGSQVSIDCGNNIIDGNKVNVLFSRMITNNGGLYEFQVNITEPLEGDFDFKNYEYLKDIIKFGNGDSNYDFDKLESKLNSLLKELNSGNTVSYVKSTVNGINESVTAVIEDDKKVMVYILKLELSK